MSNSNLEINDFEIKNYAKFRYVKVEKKRETEDYKASDYDPFND